MPRLKWGKLMCGERGKADCMYLAYTARSIRCQPISSGYLHR